MTRRRFLGKRESSNGVHSPSHPRQPASPRTPNSNENQRSWLDARHQYMATDRQPQQRIALHAVAGTEDIVAATVATTHTRLLPIPHHQEAATAAGGDPVAV